MVTFELTYPGDLRCSIVHTPSATQITTDPPVDNQGRGESFSPTDLLATALGSCMMTILAMNAQKRSVNVDGACVRIEKHMTTGAPRKVARLVVRFAMPRGIPGEHRVALEHAAKTCPVALSIHPDIAIEAVFAYPS